VRGFMAIPLDRTPASHPRCQAESLPPPSPPRPHPCRPFTSGPAGKRAGPPAIPARPECRRPAPPARPPGGLPSSALPIRIPTTPLTSGPAGRRAGPPTIPRDRKAGDERPRPSGRRALIHAAKLNPYRRHRRQGRIPATPHGAPDHPARSESSPAIHVAPADPGHLACWIGR